VLALQGVDKRFGATHAVRAVTLDAHPGEVLGLVGENGAGKSTLIKIVSGVVKPDGGRVELNGHRLALRGPRDALAHGIRSVFQELALVGSLTVAENLFLLDLPLNRLRGIERRRLRRLAGTLLDRFRVRVRPDDRVEDLPLGRRQMLEVVRAASKDPQVLLLDEATSALGGHEVGWLLRVVRELRQQGKIVLFTSHRWEEIVEFCDRVAVLRNGELVHVAETGALTRDDAVRLMTGRTLQAAFPAKAAPGQAVVLQAEHLHSATLRGVSFSLRAGEILGIGGLVGQGQRALLEAVFGVHPLWRGRLVLQGRPLRQLTPARAIKRGITYVPQERKGEGLLLQKSVAFNLTLCVLRRFSHPWLGIIRARAEHAIVADALTALQVRARSGHDPIASLSGGNQQKILLQKWFLTRPTVLLLNDVTRGVDIATKAEIYRLLVDVAGHGVGIVMYSTDTNELVHLANRVLVLRDGVVSAELSGPELTAEAIVRASISKAEPDAETA
jgi:ABC-type sugar transport system ATPase subunit